MRLIKYSAIDEIIDDLIPVFLNHNGLVPMDWTPARKAVMFSLSEDFADRLIQLNACLSEKDIESIYVSPSHYIKAAHKFQNACKNLQYSKQLVLSTYINLCNAAVIGWNAEVKEIQRKMLNMEFCSCSEKSKEEVAYLNSLIRAFSESIYCDDHTIGGDICGPILTPHGVLIVREYKRLRPIELLSILEEFKIESISTYCIYDDNKDINVDLIGNLTKCDDMVNSLQKYYIEVVDTSNQVHIIREEKQLQMLISYFVTWLKGVISWYNRLSEQEKYKLLFQCEFYAFKPLLDYYNIGWAPQSFEIVDITQKHPNGIKLREQLAMLTNQEDITQCIRKILDPRV